MSLRARLVVAVGVVLLLALVVADFAVYASLSSSLVSSVDRSLDGLRTPVQQLIAPGPHGPGFGGPGDIGSRPPGNLGEQSTDVGAPETGVVTGQSGTGSLIGQKVSAPNSAGILSATGRASVTPSTGASAQLGPKICQTLGFSVAPGTFVELANPSSGAALGQSCAAHVGNSVSYAPRLPKTIANYSSTTGANNEPVTYFTTSSTKAGGPSFRVRVSLIGPLSDERELVLAIPLTSVDDTLGRLLSIELIVSAAALLGGLLVGLWLVRFGLKPLQALEATADAIADGELTRRAPGANERTEVGHLARAFNVMLERIEGAFRARDATEGQLRRFVADASHELRTPIAAVSAYAELFDQGRALRQEDLERAMHGIRTETSRMGNLVEDLLLLARLDEGRPLEKVPLELIGVSVESIAAARAVGPGWPIALQAHQPVEVLGDELRVRQVIDNLLSNVRAHCAEGTHITLTVSEQEGWGTVAVADNGPGMAEEDLERVFQRFYRADPSRARASGGSGLGLAIVSSIVQALDGEVSVSSSLGQGSRFLIRLPLHANPEEVAIQDRG